MFMKQNTTSNFELHNLFGSVPKRLAFMEKLAGVGYWELDLKQRRFSCSDEIWRMLGMRAENKESLRLKDILPLPDYKRFFKKLRRLSRTKGQNSWEITLQTPDGKVKHCQMRAAFFCVRAQEILAGTLQDLTPLIEARDRMVQVDKEKSYFLAQASHDLRQPLQALLLFMDLFNAQNLSSEQLNLWRKIRRTTENVKNLLNNVLDLSKLSYGGAELNERHYNLGILLSDLGREFQDVATCQNLAFEFSICNVVICTDPFLLERALRNLLSNALKFAKTKVSICCRVQKKVVEIEVCDDGIGISDEDKGLIFNEFYRGRNAKETKTDGAGLGLSIVQKICNLLGAEIKLLSAPDEGSRFYVRLPLKN